MGANLKEVRERIKSVISTQQITKAMKMVSAAKLRRAQQAIIQVRPYATRLHNMMINILSNLDGDSSVVYNQAREEHSVLLVVVTSNRGLCGAFNTNILKTATAEILEKYPQQRAAKKLSIMPIGKRGADYMKRRFPDCTLVTDYVDLFNDLSFEQVAAVANQLMADFHSGKYDVIEVAYAKFKNAATQINEVEQFLPVPKPPKVTKKEKAKALKADYIFEPSKDELLQHLVPSILQITFQRYLLETHASEHGARMTAMDKATENAEELLKELKINYNKARQEAITKELSEIVGGAAALQG